MAKSLAFFFFWPQNYSVYIGCVCSPLNNTTEKVVRE